MITGGEFCARALDSRAFYIEQKCVSRGFMEGVGVLLAEESAAESARDSEPASAGRTSPCGSWLWGGANTASLSREG